MEKLSISTFERLENLQKQVCSGCGRRRMYFCCNCFVYMPGVDKLAPQLELPVKVDIIKHHGEKNSKSTAVHCLLIAPSSTRLFSSSNPPDYRSNIYASQNTVLLIHSNTASSVADYSRQHGPIRRLVILDGTWSQINGMKRFAEIQNLPVVTLKSYKTQYWRPQKNLSDEHLATIEAIYYAIVESFESSLVEECCGQVDDLLFWFYYFRSKVVACTLKDD